MQKTDLQIQSFLESNAYKSQTDWDMISAFCKDKAEISMNIEFDPNNGITASDFIEWYEHGFGAGDILKADGQIAIVGKTNFKTATIIGTLSGDKIIPTDIQTPTEGLEMASEDEIRLFRAIMLRDRQQYSWVDYAIVEKYIPHINERILFHGCGIKGIGVVRAIDVVSGEVELYCYYIYETKQCGYTMHETGICNLHDYLFESIESGGKRVTSMNNITCQRRLNRELERYGKIWNQARHRVEPVNMQVQVGKKYWYITDKFILKQDEEKGLQTSRNRALAGNYFADRMMGIEVMGRLAEVIRDFLASPESNTKR